MNSTLVKFKSIIIWIITVIVVFISTIQYLKKLSNDEKIDSNGVIVIGKIIKYYEIGISNYFMEYSYSVQNKVYKGKVRPRKIIFKNCEHDESCIGIPIYIKYYLDDVSISKPIYDSLPALRSVPK